MHVSSLSTNVPDSCSEAAIETTIITYSIPGRFCGNQNGNGNTMTIPGKKGNGNGKLGTHDSFSTKNLGGGGKAAMSKVHNGKAFP